MSLYCSMDWNCSPVNVSWLRFTIKHVGIPSSQTSTWTNIIHTPALSQEWAVWSETAWDTPACYQPPSTLSTSPMSTSLKMRSVDSTLQYLSLLLITWCPFWKLLKTLFTSKQMDGCPQYVLDLCYHMRQISKQWMRLNRLRCGTARVGDTTKLWGTQEPVMCLRTPDTVGAACGCALCDTQGPSRMVRLVSTKAWTCIHYVSNSVDIIQKEYFLRIFQSVFFILPIRQYNFLLKILSRDLLAMQT